MRETIQYHNPYDGYDYNYRIKCDNCGEYLLNPQKRGMERLPREFRTCGEDELCAMSYGWSVNEGRHVCPKCTEELVAKGLNP